MWRGRGQVRGSTTGPLSLGRQVLLADQTVHRHSLGSISGCGQTAATKDPWALPSPKDNWRSPCTSPPRTAAPPVSRTVPEVARVLMRVEHTFRPGRGMSPCGCPAALGVHRRARRTRPEPTARPARRHRCVSARRAGGLLRRASPRRVAYCKGQRRPRTRVVRRRLFRAKGTRHLRARTRCFRPSRRAMMNSLRQVDRRRLW